MRELRFKQKIAKRVTIPEWLVAFFRSVNVRILEEDERAVTPSDDVLQAVGVCGGLIDEGGNLYRFTVFPGPDNPFNRPRWEITLSVEHIRQIAEKKSGHLDLWECRNPECSNLFSTPGDVCIYCDYYDDERDARNLVKAELAQRSFEDKEAWVYAYLAHFPEDHPMKIIGEYNSTGLGEDLGWFSLSEMESVIARFRSSARVMQLSQDIEPSLFPDDGTDP